MKKVIITVKHHDGYNTWQTKYNDKFSVKKSPWKNGKGDVLKLLATSAKKYGLKLGVYLSPADLFQIESKDGLYGNLSKYQNSIIPTDPASLQTNPLKQRKVKNNLPTFNVKADDYNRYFMNQLYELLTEYGPVHEVWFDGAHPKRKGGQKYIKSEWFAMIRKLQPQAVIFGGPDVRWCGNEHGGTRKTEWNILPVDSLPVSGEDRPANRIGDDKNLTAGGYSVYGKKYKNNYLYYIISEVDTSIRKGWFWRNDTEQKVRNADEIFDIYERSVGSGTVFLLNTPPNDKGRFSPRDVACLTEVGKRITATYSTDIAAGATANVPNLFDHNIKTYWQTKNKNENAIITLPQPRTFNRIAIQEAISEVGQRVKQHAVDAWINGSWKEIATATTIGYKKILRFPTIQTTKLRLRILDARDNAAIATLAIHNYQEPLASVLLNRDSNGTVSLSIKAHNAKIRYTLDGSTPNNQSNIYTKPLHLPKGALLKATGFSGNQTGPTLEQQLGLSTKNWKATATSTHTNNYNAAFAIDNNPKTYWHSSWAKGHPTHPHTLTVQLPQTETLTGFTYLPRQDRRVPDGMIEQGYFESSTNGKTWTKITSFTFGNLLNSPDQRIKLFDKPVKAKYVRLVSTKGAQNKPYAAIAELGLLSN